MKQKLDRQKVRGTVLNLVAKHRQVIYGGQSINYFLPKPLRRKTKDIDILTKKPRLSAEQTVKALNRKFNHNRFQVIPATHRGTFKVKDTKTGETIADYTGTTKKPSSYKRFGVRFAKEGYSVKKLKKILKDPSSKHRWEKDKDTLERIRRARRSIKI